MIDYTCKDRSSLLSPFPGFWEGDTDKTSLRKSKEHKEKLPVLFQERKIKQ
jgi:hypothetical protein